MDIPKSCFNSSSSRTVIVSRRRTFTREFKIQTGLMLTADDASAPQVAEDLGIHPNTLYKWVSQYGEHSDAAFPGKGRQTSESEMIHQLQRDNQQLRMARNILKKVVFWKNDKQQPLFRGQTYKKTPHPKMRGFVSNLGFNLLKY